MSVMATSPPSASTLVLTDAMAAPGVDAGALLGVASPGTDLASVVGPGVVGLALDDGSHELRAARDGAPEQNAGTVGVETTSVHEGHVDATSGDVRRHGSLRVRGSVAPGRTVAATGSVVIEGMADRAELWAGGTLVVEGRATGCDMCSGVAVAAWREAYRPLRDATVALDQMVGEARQIVAASGRRGSPAPLTTVLPALAAGRRALLAEDLERVERALAAARKVWPGLLEQVHAAVQAARSALAGQGAAGADPLTTLQATARVLDAATPERRPGGDGMRVASADRCALEVRGSLRFTGRGARECDMTVWDDLYAMAPGSQIVAGVARVGGVVRARELAGREGAWLRVELEDARPAGDLLRAEAVQVGVEVVTRGHIERFDVRRSDVVVSADGGHVEVRHGGGERP